MKTVTIPVAYMPLVDAAPLIVAQDLGFAEAEGLSLDLIAAPSWSSVRDMLAFGRVDAAHMLSPVPVAMAMGLGGVTTALSAVSVLSVNGNVIGVARLLEDRLRAAGHDFAFDDAAKAGAALASVVTKRLVVGVPFPFSMHAELLHYWFDGTPLGAVDKDIRVVPPPLMAKAIADGEIDAFCVGEPWGSVTVEAGAGALLLPGKAIWSFAPEKVLAVRSGWVETEPHLVGCLMRAVYKAGRWLSLPESRIAASTLLSRKEYLDVPAEIIDRALSGHLTISSLGEQRQVEGFVEFNRGAATFPWRSQAKWIGQSIARRTGADMSEAMAAAGTVFRSDLYRKELQSTTADLPGASEKLEGSLSQDTPVASETGRLILRPDRFFDGRIFDPSAKP